METRQFVAVKFRPADRRSYTYHWDGEPLVPGDEVRVPDRSGDGWMRAKVEEVLWKAPAFATKAIIGRADEPAPAKEGELPL